MSKPSSSPVQVVAGIVIKDDAILISQRPLHKHMGGLWEFPGGKVQPGESHPSALVRELEEELNITVKVGSLFYQVEHQYPEISVHLFFYLSEITSGEPKSLEANPFQWVTASQLSDFKFPPADAELISRLSGHFPE